MAGRDPRRIHKEDGSRTWRRLDDIDDELTTTTWRQRLDNDFTTTWRRWRRLDEDDLTTTTRWWWLDHDDKNNSKISKNISCIVFLYNSITSSITNSELFSACSGAIICFHLKFVFPFLRWHYMITFFLYHCITTSHISFIFHKTSYAYVCCIVSLLFFLCFLTASFTSSHMLSMVLLIRWALPRHNFSVTRFCVGLTSDVATT